jgi:hypothetical protein
VWRYTVSHAQLLLRSTQTDTFPTQIDVLFKLVDWMSLPTHLTGLIVEFADPEQAQFMSEASGISLEDRASRFFVVRGSNYQGYIVAGVNESPVSDLRTSAAPAYKERASGSVA